MLPRRRARVDQLREGRVICVHGGLRGGERGKRRDDERGVGAGGEDLIDESGHQCGGAGGVAGHVVCARHQEDDLSGGKIAHFQQRVWR